LQWNNWVQIIKMRKNQTANQNQPSVITYPQNNFSLIRPAAHTLLSAWRVCYTRQFWQTKFCHVSLCCRFKQCWIHSTPLSSTSLFPHLQHSIGKVPSVESRFQHFHCTWSRHKYCIPFTFTLMFTVVAYGR